MIKNYIDYDDELPTTHTNRKDRLNEYGQTDKQRFKSLFIYLYIGASIIIIRTRKRKLQINIVFDFRIV